MFAHVLNGGALRRDALQLRSVLSRAFGIHIKELLRDTDLTREDVILSDMATSQDAIGNREGLMYLIRVAP